MVKARCAAKLVMLVKFSKQQKLPDSVYKQRTSRPSSFLPFLVILHTVHHIVRPFLRLKESSNATATGHVLYSTGCGHDVQRFEGSVCNAETLAAEGDYSREVTIEGQRKFEGSI